MSRDAAFPVGTQRSAEIAGQAHGSNGRDHVLIGKERNDIGRPGDAGYPTRGIVTAGAECTTAIETIPFKKM